ncbi:MAG TPA: sensor histidine kinase, partial [Thermoanaerobaculia bacterium]|nr:sensor histidine kinase [Thermoanaerobaculia bacterium]
MERTRARLAADLHDDVGSTLSQIAVLAEVLRSEVPESDSLRQEPLQRMARISREAVDAMGDMVWAINPARDHLGDLRHRISRYAAETLPEAGVDVELPGPAGDDEDALDTDVKRETYLVAKEALHNVVKHAHASRAVLELTVDAGELVLSVTDDGRGFDAGDANDGNGLASMRRRGERIGGSLAVASAKGKGTTVTLRVPRRRPRLPTRFGGMRPRGTRD